MPDAATVKSLVFAAITKLLEDNSVSITDDTPLIGGESLFEFPEVG